MDHEFESEGKKQMLLNKMVERAQAENGSIRSIFDEECLRSDIGHLMDYATVEQRLLKARKRSRPPLPASVEELDEAVRTSRYATLNGSPFYRESITASNGQTAAIFISEEAAQRLQTAERIHFDGTFKTCPGLFYQNFVVFFEFFGTVFPGCYALMTGKSQELYTLVFTYLRDYFLLYPTSIMSDWEAGSRNAARIIWPSSSVKGCFFHFTQAAQRKLKKLRLGHFLANAQAKKVISRILCLPLLPPTLIEPTFGQIRERNTFNILTPWMQYVERNWIMQVRADELSVHEQMHRTNKYAESTFAYSKTEDA